MYNSIESKNKTKIDIQKTYSNSTTYCELCLERFAVSTIVISKNHYETIMQVELCKQCLRATKALINTLL